MKSLVIRKDKGFAGLNVLLSVIVMLFVIGFLVMIFVLLGSSIEETAYDSISGTIHNETATSAFDETPGLQLDQGKYNSPTCNLLYAWNSTAQVEFNIANWSVTDCWITFQGTADDAVYGLNDSAGLNFTYSYTVDMNSTASGVAYDTTQTLGGVTDWFGIIIVITAMLVLILLTIIIISTISGSGLIGVGGGTPRTTA